MGPRNSRRSIYHSWRPVNWGLFVYLNLRLDPTRSYSYISGSWLTGRHYKPAQRKRPTDINSTVQRCGWYVPSPLPTRSPDLFQTNAADAGIFLIFANLDPSKGYKGITCFVAEKEWGVQIAKKEKKVLPPSAPQFNSLARH